MKIFYKVHKKDFDNFILYINKKYNDKKFIEGGDHNLNIKKRYYDDSYLYLSVDDIRGCDGYYLRQMSCTSDDFAYLMYKEWEYQGEFNNRKSKLQKLNSIANKL